jgi:hypothetical protein
MTRIESNYIFGLLSNKTPPGGNVSLHAASACRTKIFTIQSRHQTCHTLTTWPTPSYTASIPLLLWNKLLIRGIILGHTLKIISQITNRNFSIPTRYQASHNFSKVIKAFKGYKYKYQINFMERLFTIAECRSIIDRFELNVDLDNQQKVYL